MRKVWSGTVIACLVFMVVMGCRGGGQLYQVKDAPVQTATGKELTMDEMQKAAAVFRAVLRPVSTSAGARIEEASWH